HTQDPLTPTHFPEAPMDDQSGQTTPPIDSNKVDADDTKAIAKALEGMNQITRETGVDLAALGDAWLGINSTIIRFRSVGTGREVRYQLDLSSY
ncbi:hypothetical protein ABZ741_34165, partial [Streptomyces globisporus]|uniref:hypothetical protein n=1 Tax=Streptomyces globisporus TaxID=1908 RepID=UPI00345F1CC5